MNEIWKEISGYEGLYEVSDLGRVKSLGNNKSRKEKILKLGKDTVGYLYANLWKNGHGKNLLVHRLVAEAFIPNPNNLPTVNHKDENKENNAPSNLEWMTIKDNLNYGTRNRRVAEAHSKQVQMFDKSTGELLEVFPSTHEAEMATGVAHQSIGKCCLGKLKSAGGYIWRYL